MNFYITRCVCLFARYVLLGYVLESFVFLKHNNNNNRNIKQMFSMHANQTRISLSSTTYKLQIKKLYKINKRMIRVSFLLFLLFSIPKPI